MQASEDADLLVGQATKPGIGRMHMQRHLGLREPLPQRFGIDGKQLTAINDGKTLIRYLEFERERKLPNNVYYVDLGRPTGGAIPHNHE
jgi:hypothetical protein